MLPWLVEHSPLSRMRDWDAELLQLGSIRILVGTLCIARLVPTLWVSLYMFPPEAGGAAPELVVRGVWVLALTAQVTVGFLTPLAVPVLIVAMRGYELSTDGASLVTDMASLVLMFLVLAGAGSTRSVDAWLMRKDGWSGSAVKTLYRIVGPPSLDGLAKLYVLSFLAYALIHFGGAMHHWQTEAWTSRQALAMVFSSSYLARFWEVYRAVELSWPSVALVAAANATAVQLLMQTLTPVLMFWRRSAPVAVAWGFFFTASSMLLLQLNYLGAFEFLLWFVLFHRPRQHTGTPVLAPLRSRVTDKALHAFLIVCLTLFVMTDVATSTGLVTWEAPRLTSALRRVGLHAPDVFNDNDLGLGDQWPVIYAGDRKELLPFHGPNGERLRWTQWSDVLFYSISNRWKNEFNERDLFDLSDDGVTRLRRLALFDHRRRGAIEGRYVVDYFQTRASHVGEPPSQRFDRVHLGSMTIVCSGAGAGAECSAVDTTDARPR
jgi:hypothetical protein